LKTHQETKIGLYGKLSVWRAESMCNYQNPYSQDEIRQFEKDNDIKLPLEFRSYLAQTKSLYRSHLDFSTIELNKNKIIKLPINSEGIYFLSQSDYDYDDENDNPAYNTKVLEIRDIGCGYTNVIVLEGEYAGTIWCEQFSGDGPLTRIFGSFFDYVLNPNK
jgi:hypothetical protein